MTSLFESMEIGRFYLLEELPGYTQEACSYQLRDTTGRALNFETNAFLVREVVPLVTSGKLRGAYRLKISGEIFADAKEVPLSYGDPPVQVGLEDLEVLYVRD